MDDGMMRIAELARRTGASTSTLRYYEDQGLLTPDTRSGAQYRLYGSQAACRVGFIQRAKALGMTLAEIRRLVHEPVGGEAAHRRLSHAIAHKLADTDRRIAELQTLQGELEALQTTFEQAMPACGHIGDCECWLPLKEEVIAMAANDGCDCCGCTCPNDGTCTCCGCNCAS